jgi:hypothetical protein
MFWQQSNSEFRMALAENEEFTVPYGSSNDLKSKKKMMRLVVAFHNPTGPIVHQQVSTKIDNHNLNGFPMCTTSSSFPGTNMYTKQCLMQTVVSLALSVTLLFSAIAI